MYTRIGRLPRPPTTALGRDLAQPVYLAEIQDQEAVLPVEEMTRITLRRGGVRGRAGRLGASPRVHLSGQTPVAIIPSRAI